MEEELEIHFSLDVRLRVSLYVAIHLDEHNAHETTGYFPRLILLVPHVAILGVLLATHPSIRGSGGPENSSPKGLQAPPPSQPGEGSVDWLANLQAIQNLMGAV